MVSVMTLRAADGREKCPNLRQRLENSAPPTARGDANRGRLGRLVRVDDGRQFFQKFLKRSGANSV
jgi:hypothetical protein